MGRCDFEYKCNHPAVQPRTKSDTIDLLPSANKEMQGTKPACGEFWINLYVWDRTKDYLSQSHISAKDLDAQCGVSLFRDHLRVLPYGEPGNDWLLLDQERIQDPSGRIGNNQVIGLIEVLQDKNLQLRDTTNREGLIENSAFKDLKALSRAAIRLFTTYWKKDRPPARQQATRHGSIDIARKVAAAMKETASDDLEVEVPVTATVEKNTQEGEVPEANEPSTTVTQRRAVEILIDNLEGIASTDREKEKRIERLLELAATGLAAERVVHEFGRQVAAANEALNQLRRLAPGGSRSLDAVNLLDTCLTTLRSEFRILAPYETIDRLPQPAPISAREAAELALTINKRFIEEQRIQAAVLGDDFQVRTRQAWLVQVIDNLVNNACHWLAGCSSNSKILHIILDRNESQMLILDNGPGIHEEARAHLFEPFFSMKAGGTGLGLYISKEVMRQLSGDIRLLTGSDPRVEPRFSSGAAFILDFNSATARRSK